MKRYLVITDIDLTSQDENGQTVVIPAGTAINEVLWDGVSDYTPPPDTHLVTPD